MCATRETNNSAEMQALIGALYWLNSGIEDKSIHWQQEGVGYSGFAVRVKGLTDQKFTARENEEIAYASLVTCGKWSRVKSVSTYDRYVDTLVIHGKHYC